MRFELKLVVEGELRVQEVEVESVAKEIGDLLEAGVGGKGVGLVEGGVGDYEVDGYHWVFNGFIRREPGKLGVWGLGLGVRG